MPSELEHGRESRQSNGALRLYDELKLEVAQLAQAGMQLCRQSKDEEGDRLYRSLLARLAEDRFNLAVVGPFNRGKSTLMNALLGMNRLPTGVLPHTSVITTVTYGSKEQVLIRCAGWSLPQQISLDRLAEFVTEQGNPSNQRQVSLAEIQLPSEMLRRGFQLVDTPGLNSGIAANTKATENFVPEIDAAIFVLSADSPLDKADTDMLRRLYEEVRTIFIVINKLDLLVERDRTAVIEFVRQRLASDLGQPKQKIYALSAKQGLQSKMARDFEELNKSGLPELENAISSFLATEKLPQLCSRMLDRLQRLLKRQRLDIAVAVASGQDPERFEAVRSQFKRETDELLRQTYVKSASIHELLSSKLMKQLDGELSSFFQELIARVTRKTLPALSSKWLPLQCGRMAGILRSSDASCQRLTSEWIASARLITIEPAIERISGKSLRELEGLPNQIWRIAARVSGTDSDTASHQPEKIECERKGLDLLVPQLSRTFPERVPLWFAFVPTPWFSQVLQKWFETRLRRTIRGLRDQIKDSIRRSSQEYVERVAATARHEIEERAARMTASIGAGERRREAARIEALLQRTNAMQGRLHRLPGSTEGFMPSKVDLGEQNGSGLGEEVCPVCVYAAEVFFVFMSKRQYDLSVNESVQAAHAEAGGFCSLHTWMYSEIASPQGICNAYSAMLNNIADKLNSRLSSSPEIDCDELAITLSRVRSINPDCPACSVIKGAETEKIEDLIRIVNADGTAVQTQVVPVLCLRHLDQAVRTKPDLKIVRQLWMRAAKGFERSAENMRRYALKHDALRRNLLTHEEQIAYFIALTRVAGDKRLVPRWAEQEL